MKLPSHGLVRLARFCLVGASGVCVDMGILFLLVDGSGLGVSIPLAKACAVEIAIMNNFLWNERWTFRDLAAAQPRGTGWASRFARFNCVCLVGLLIGVGLITVLTHGLRMNLYVANLVTIVMVTGWNFAANLRFTWAHRKPTMAPALR